MTSLILVALGASFAMSCSATWLVRAAARRIGFVDRPRAHKKHAHPIALGGGVAFVVGIGLPLLIGTTAAYVWRDGSPPAFLPTLLQRHLEGVASKLPTIAAIVGCMLALHVTGLIDDRRALGPAPKFIVQFAVAVVTAGLMGVRLLEFLPAPLSVAATVLWIVAITNAFNFLDNMDGLSAGVAAICAAIFAIAAMTAGQIFVPVMAWVIVGTLAGFLVFNLSPASIFMGDAGSLVIGYLMSVVPILTTFYDPDQSLRPTGVLVPVVVLAVPIYDAISVITLRVYAGTNPFRGDHRHFSHRLVKRGMSRRRAVLTIYLATAATGLPAIALPRVDWPIAILLLVQCLCVLTMVAVLEHAAPNGDKRV